MSSTSTNAVARAQKLRLQRTLMGGSAYACTALFVVGFYLVGIVEAAPVVHYLLAVLVINLIFIGLVVSGLNLRLKEPSMTAAQVVASLWPSIYIMYFLEVPQARMAFLLTAMFGMLFGTLVYGFRRIVGLGAIVLFTYLLLLAALVAWAPQRVDLRVEAVIVFAYGLVLVLIGFVGGQMYRLRQTLKSRNQELEEAVGELKDLATKDPLTRLPNRRSLMDQLAHEQSRVERRRPDSNRLCLCLLDVDHFKRINDTYGHNTGDVALQHVAHSLRNILRTGDFVGRYGGEEFLLILPESTREGAGIAAERVRKAIESTPMPGLPESERITVSIGVAVHAPRDTVEATLARADRALYHAKDAGRNQVYVAQNSDAPEGAPQRADHVPAEGPDTAVRHQGNAE